MILAVIFSGGIVAVAVFSIGLVPDMIYWNDANVPLLGIQIVGVIAGSLLFMGLSLVRAFLLRGKNPDYNKFFRYCDLFADLGIGGRILDSGKHAAQLLFTRSLPPKW